MGKSYTFFQVICPILNVYLVTYQMFINCMVLGVETVCIVFEINRLPLNVHFFLFDVNVIT